MISMDVYAVSDLHVDYASNWNWLLNISDCDYVDDVLLIAGDVSHQLARLEKTFSLLSRKFKQVFFVSGNHELWIMRGESGNSLQKFESIIELCRDMEIETRPKQFGVANSQFTVVPLYCWYVLPEGGSDSLYIASVNETVPFSAWADNHLVRWPAGEAQPIADYFMSLNNNILPSDMAGDIISFSHFLPRYELMYASQQERSAYIGKASAFNFSRVAGTKALERKIRSLGSKIHVYGHQHRNRSRTIDGVRYISCCLGYERERKENRISLPNNAPVKIWSESFEFA